MKEIRMKTLIIKATKELSPATLSSFRNKLKTDEKMKIIVDGYSLSAKKIVTVLPSIQQNMRQLGIVHWKLALNYRELDKDIIQALHNQHITFAGIADLSSLPQQELENVCQKWNDTITKYEIKIFYTENLNSIIPLLADWINQSGLFFSFLPPLVEHIDNYQSFLLQLQRHMRHMQNFLFEPVMSMLAHKLCEKGKLHLPIEEHEIYVYKEGRYCMTRVQNDLIACDHEYIADSIYNYLADEAANDLKQNALKRQMRNQKKNMDVPADITLISMHKVKYGSSFPPMGLYALHAYLKEHGYTANVLDLDNEDIMDTLEKEIQHGVNILGFSCLCDNRDIITNTIKYLKSKYSELIIFIGGPEAYDLNESYIRETNCDVIMEGEGELVIKELMDYFTKGVGDLKQLTNIKFIDKSTGKYQPCIKTEIVADLNKLPFITQSFYQENPKYDKEIVRIFTGKGCPFRCAFCFEGSNMKRVRYRDMDLVFQEIQALLHTYPNLKRIQICDDTFTCNRDRVMDFCRRIKQIRENRDINWICEIHVQTVANDLELLHTMIEAGMKSAQIGIESGSQKVLNAYNKMITPDMVSNIVKEAAANQIFLEGNLIIGGAFESQETLEASLQLGKRLLREGLGYCDISTVFFWPFVNTPMRICPEKYGIEILPEQVEKSIFTMMNPVIRTEALSHQDIMQAKKFIDDELQKEYRRLSLQIPQKIFNHIVMHSKNQWTKNIYHFEHLRNCAESIYNLNYISSPISDYSNVYPVRTFYQTSYIDEVLGEYNLKFTDIERKILDYSTGKYSIFELAYQILHIDFDTLVSRIKDLENRCFIRLRKL